MEQAHAVVPLAASQFPYSIVNRGIEADRLPWCIEHGVAIIPHTPLQRGLLTEKLTADHEFEEGDHKRENAFFKPSNIRKVNAFLEEFRPIRRDHEATFAQIAIAWTIHRPVITSALVGAKNRRQVEENVKAASLELTEEEIACIDELLEGLTLEL